MKRNRNGQWIYKVYDAKSHELLAKGTSREVAKIMNWSDYYALRLADLYIANPKRRPRYEYVLRDWVESVYVVKDYETGETFKGSFEECKKEIRSRVGYELKENTLNKYFNNCSKRFGVRRLTNV